MAVNWGLANPGGGFDALESLQAIGNQAAQRQQMKQRDYGFQQQRQQDQARPQIQQQAAAGDFAGAAAQAFSLGDYDALKYVGGLEAAKHAQLAGEADTIGRLATSLIGLPQEQRQAAFAAVAPQLRQAGFDDSELAAVQLDDGALQAYIKLATDTKTALSSYAKSQEPISVSDGTDVIRGDGSVLYQNGRDAKWQFDSESGSWLQEPGTGGAPAVLPTGASAGPAQQQMAAHLSSAGLPAPVVAGFMGNFDAEGGYTGAQGDGGSAGGVAQWRGERRANFQRVIGKDPTAANMQEQAAFVKWELDNPQAAGMTVAQRDAILNARSPEEAADLIDRHYERSSGEHRERRVSAARQFAGGAGPQAGVVNVRPPKAKDGNAPSGYRFNGDRLEPIAGGPADPATATSRNVQSNRKAEADFRKEFDALPEVKTFKTARQQFNTLRDLGTKKNPTPQDDIALIFSYMKTLDPSSVVREGEFAQAQNAGSVPENIRNAYNKALQGTRLNPQQRKDMVRTAYRNYSNYRDAYNQAAENYRGYARDNGIVPDRVARTYTPDKPTPKANRMSQFKIVKVR